MLISALIAVTIPAISAEGPPSGHNLRLEAPIENWDEAIPLGNGLTGCLLWGGSHEIRLSLDRGDLWDERTNGPKEWWKTETWKKGGPMWENAYRGATPTKLPAGAVFFTLPEQTHCAEFVLDKAGASGSALLSGGAELQVFASATEPVILARLKGTSFRQVEVLDPVAVSGRLRGVSAGPDSHSVNALGYPKAENISEKTPHGTVSWYRQKAFDGLAYGVVCEARARGDETHLAIAVAATTDGGNWLDDAKRRCSAALDKGFEPMKAEHAGWWKKFWQQSRVEIPDDAVHSYYQFARYLYGAGSRANTPPIPLQGVWTAATGSLPPWKGDYHSDLNTQMTYIAYQASGHFPEGASYLNYLWDKRDVWRAFARDFYETPGLSVPGVMSLSGQPLGGWAAYSLSPTMTSWNAHLFYLHWLYTGDGRFLRERAYPWCLEAAQCVRALLKPDADGILKLPRSSSPEIGGNRWVAPNSNYDMMSMRMHFLAVAEMAAAQGLDAEAAKWRESSRQLGDYHVAPDGELLIAKDAPLRESHRHHSHVMALFPFNLLTVDGTDEDRRRIATTLARPEFSKSRHHEWTGYSWSWMSCIRARTGDAEGALRNLDVFLNAYVTRNGFHVNQDQTSTAQFGAGGGRPFTLEGNFIAMQAVHEMLLQSWSPSPGIPDTGVIRLFPATAWRWHKVSFTDLRAEGGHRVSARRENNATIWFRIVAGKNGIIRIRDNFDGRTPKWNVAGVKKVGLNFEITSTKGQMIEGSLTPPASVPPAPADLAEPVIIRKPGAIATNNLPLRIGAASTGDNRFHGDIAHVTCAGRAFSEAELAKLGDSGNEPSALKIEPVVGAKALPSLDALAGKAYRMDGNGYLEIPNNAGPDTSAGLTLAAWIRPAELPATGMRIIDKCPVSSPQGYLLDTYPNDSLRLITREPHFGYHAKLQIGKWTHVAATVDGTTGKQKLYINGKPVAAN